MIKKNIMVIVMANPLKQTFRCEQTDCFVVPPRNDDTTVIANEVKQSF
jgi:hypothetical protein